MECTDPTLQQYAGWGLGDVGLRIAGPSVRRSTSRCIIGSVPLLTTVAVLFFNS